MPRPDKCPFCAAPVEGDGPVCQQCGFDLASDWQPASEDEAQGVFDPRVRACTACGELNPLNADFCSKCNAPVGNCVSMKPFESLLTEGFIYRRCVTGRRETLSLLARLAQRTLGAMFLVGGVFLLLCLCSAKFDWRWVTDHVDFGYGVSFRLASKWDAPLAALLGVLVVWLGLLLLGVRLCRRTETPAAADRPEASPAGDDREAK